MLIRQKSLQLAGKAAMPDSVISRCQVDKHGTGLLLSLKRVLDILRERNDLVHSRSAVSKSSLLPRELWTDNWFHTGMDKRLEDLVGNTKQRYWVIALRFSSSFLGFGIATTSASSQRKQEERKPHNQDFGEAPAWSISSEQTGVGTRSFTWL